MLAALDAHLLARTHVLVGKFTSGLFRVAYALAAARRGALLPFVSLDAPWCSDYGIPAGYNDNFPQRREGAVDSYEQVVPAGEGTAEGRRAINLNSMANVFLC